MLLFLSNTKNKQTEQQQTFVPPVTYIFVLFLENSGSRATDWEKTSNINETSETQKQKQF